MYLNRRVWNYGLVSYDRPNVLTINFLYDVPRLSRVLPNPAGQGSIRRLADLQHHQLHPGLSA